MGTLRLNALGRDGRAAEGACLENRYRATCRGFESHSLRQIAILRSHAITNIWGGARVVEWGRLLSGCRGNTSTAGSNPALPATTTFLRHKGHKRIGKLNGHDYVASEKSCLDCHPEQLFSFDW